MYFLLSLTEKYNKDFIFVMGKEKNENVIRKRCIFYQFLSLNLPYKLPIPELGLSS